MFAASFLPLLWRVKKDRARLLAVPVLVLVFYLISAPFVAHGDYGVLSCTIFLFGLFVMPLFFEEILPVLTPYHILSFTILFWYVFAVSHMDIHHLESPAPPIDRTWFAVCLAGSTLVFFRPAAGSRLQAIHRLALVAWYLGMVAYIGISQFDFGDLDFLDGVNMRPGPLPSLPAVFLTGMGSMILLSNFALIEMFVYMVTHRERSLMDAMSRKYHALALRLGKTTVFLGVQLAVSILNSRWTVVPHSIYVNGCILAFPPLIAWLLSRGGDVKGAKQGCFACAPPVVE
ncbi:MAG: hypothetical protein NTY77_13110 [Elusimicrobia bacterium]|nr:hypothetical protein [Elusimicrobiota bacterium]